MQRIALIASLLLVSCTAYRRQAPAPQPTVEACAPAREAADFGVDVIPLQFASAADIAQIVGHVRLSDPGTNVLADVRTNSVIVNGPESGRRAAAELIAKLDIKK